RRDPPVSFEGDNIRNQAQNPGAHFGKVLRLNDDGTPHPGNRFSGVPPAPDPRSGVSVVARSRARPATR
ncbi:MAG: hypothetical protein WAM94_07305, partial [Chromatiaceae bacterium]